MISVEIDLNSRGILLKNDVSKELGVPGDHLKLICTGKVISDQLTLRDQNIKVIDTPLEFALDKSRVTYSDLKIMDMFIYVIYSKTSKIETLIFRNTNSK